MESVRNLLDKIVDNDVVETGKEFEKVLSVKLAAALDKKKKEVSKSLFTDPIGVGTEDEETTDEVE